VCECENGSQLVFSTLFTPRVIVYKGSHHHNIGIDRAVHMW